ncbi:MAG: hypothetical protein M3N07_03910 [Pseudomonadota bacterium]|nr:hypothetical protein [Pseudomonadota bacterium]
MNAAYFAIGAALAAISVVFFARAGRTAEPAKARGARLVGALFVLAGLFFIAAGAISLAKD